MRDCRLYLITPSVLPQGFADVLAAALDGGDVTALQLRLKDAPETEIAAAVRALKPMAEAHGVALILNDRPDLAAETGCDGAHVGGEDMSPAEARRVLGKKLQLGVSCYDSRDLALRAGEADADYVAFGAFFPSSTKATGISADLDLLSWWAEIMELPVVAIGGITADNCAPIVRAGANFLAVVNAIWNNPAGPAAAVAALNQAIKEA